MAVEQPTARVLWVYEVPQVRPPCLPCRFAAGKRARVGVELARPALWLRQAYLPPLD